LQDSPGSGLQSKEKRFKLNEISADAQHAVEALIQRLLDASVTPVPGVLQVHAGNVETQGDPCFTLPSSREQETVLSKYFDELCASLPLDQGTSDVTASMPHITRPSPPPTVPPPPNIPCSGTQSQQMDYKAMENERFILQEILGNAAAFGSLSMPPSLILLTRGLIELQGRIATIETSVTLQAEHLTVQNEISMTVRRTIQSLVLQWRDLVVRMQLALADHHRMLKRHEGQLSPVGDPNAPPSSSVVERLEALESKIQRMENENAALRREQEIFMAASKLLPDCNDGGDHAGRPAG